jgi:hypothetical protein
MRRIALLLVATGIAGAASAHERPEPPRGCSAIEVTAPGLHKQPRDLVFSTRKILDLEFEARLDQPVYGQHLMHFRVTTPSGFLYQDLQVPFDWPKPGHGRKGGSHEEDDVRPAANAAPGVPVQQLGAPDRRGRRRDTLLARLPVAGTSITMSTLYGRWSIQAFLDGHNRPCSPLQRFTIRAN